MTCFLSPTIWSSKIMSDMKNKFIGWRKKFVTKTRWTWLCNKCSPGLFMPFNITLIFWTRSLQNASHPWWNLLSSQSSSSYYRCIWFLFKANQCELSIVFKDSMNLSLIKFLHQRWALPYKRGITKNKCDRNQSRIIRFEMNPPIKQSWNLKLLK